MIKDDYIPWVKLILALYVLKILQEGSAYGNKIAEEIKERTQGLIMPNTNSLYPLLRIMEERGYIIGKWDNPDRRGKRIYKITELGMHYIPTLEEKARDRFIQIEDTIAVLRKNLFEDDCEEQE